MPELEACLAGADAAKNDGRLRFLRGVNMEQPTNPLN